MIRLHLQIEECPDQEINEKCRNDGNERISIAETKSSGSPLYLKHLLIKLHTQRLTKKQIFIVGALLGMMFVFELTSSLTESQTVDEGTHLAAGYSYLIKRDFRMNVEHPPLLKELSAIPLVVADGLIDSPFDKKGWAADDQWQFARDLLYDGGMHADTILLLARLPMMLVSIILGLFIFLWSRELFGTTAGFFSLFLYSLSPNFIAHSRYVTTDVGLSLFFFLTLYYFHKYLKRGNRKNMVLTAVFLGCALVSKFSAVILVPILMLLQIFYLLKSKNRITAVSIKKFITNGLIVFAIIGLVIMSAYLFEFKIPIDDPDVQYQFARRDSLLATSDLSNENILSQKIIPLADPTKPFGSFIEWFAHNVPVPAYSYFKGLWSVYTHNLYGHTSYLLGQHSEFGWWYYFPVAFLIKTPISTQIFLLLLLVFGISYFFRKNSAGTPFYQKLRSISMQWYILILPPVIYFLFSMNSHLNLGVRHIFPIYPFVFVLCGFLLTVKMKKLHKPYRMSIVLLTLFYAFSSVATYPNYLAYFNEAIGGPKNGSDFLVDSNIDWGQSAKQLKQYMLDRNIEYVCISYFGQANLSYYGIDYRYLPDTENYQGTSKLNCVVAISVTSLLSKDHKYSWLQSFKPDDMVGYSIFIYDFSEKLSL